MAQLKVIKNSGGPGSAGAGKAGSRDAQESLQYGFGEANDRAVAIGTVNVVATSWQQAVNAFRATRTAHNKRLQIELYHLEQSFRADELDANNPDDWARANEIGVATARALWPTRQTVVVTQNDNGLLHNHFFVNNVDPLTGLACRGDEMSWTRMMPIHDEVLASLGHQQPSILPTTVDEGLERAEKARVSQREQFRADLAYVFDETATPSWEAAEQRAASVGFELGRRVAKRDSRGAKKGQETLTFKARVHKRTQTYDAYRYGVDLAEAKRRIAAAAALAPQRAAQPVARPAYDPKAGISDDLAAALDAIKSGQPIPVLAPLKPEPSRTQSVTEPEPERLDVEPAPATQAVAKGDDEVVTGVTARPHEPAVVAQPIAKPRRKSTAQIAVERWEAEQAQQGADDAQYGT